MSTIDRGRALRFIIAAGGWTGPDDPEEFERVHTKDMALLIKLLDEVREHERRRLAKVLSAEANRIYSKQAKDFPSNVLDQVANHLRTGEALTPSPTGGKEGDKKQ